jgi:hypothetical protein
MQDIVAAKTPYRAVAISNVTTPAAISQQGRLALIIVPAQNAAPKTRPSAMNMIMLKGLRTIHQSRHLMRGIPIRERSLAVLRPLAYHEPGG